MDREPYAKDDRNRITNLFTYQLEEWLVVISVEIEPNNINCRLSGIR